MRILIVTQYYPPEIGAAQNRLSRLATSLREAGHTVTVLTALPNYPKGAIYEGYTNGLVATEIKDGITIIRTWLYTKQNLQFVGRLIHYLSFSMLALIVSVFKIGRQDIVITECPTLFAGIAGWVISKMKRAKFVLNVSDLWTDSAVDLGMLKNNTLISIALRVEKFLYQHAHLITGQTQGIVNSIRARVGQTPVALITNGVDQDFFSRAESLHMKEQRNGEMPLGKFIVGFAGLHGLMQDLETVMEAARLLREDKHIAFVLYGDGPKKEKLIRLSKEAQIQNVTFLPPQPAERMPEIFSSFDAMLVPLKDLPILRGAIPCKMLEAMGAAVPILLLAEGEAKNLVLQAECGIVLAQENPKLLAEAVRELYHNDSFRRRLGQNGRRYTLEHYNRQRINKRFEDLLAKVFHGERIGITETCMHP
jgi:glycosyltransferase involved in cell wall biosynthesis